MNKQYSAACERNREPILAILQPLFAKPVKVLEIGSGTGQHAVYFGEHLPHVTWQTSDLADNHPSILAWMEEARLPNVLAPLTLDVSASDWQTGQYDAIFSANTCHIMAWPQVEQMFAGFPQIMRDGGLVCLYGPFNYEGKFTSGSNAAFDASLRAQAPHRGIRDFEAVDALAQRAGLRLLADNAMPAHNRLLVWQRSDV